jgi:hypothetical protein
MRNTFRRQYRHSRQNQKKPLATTPMKTLILALFTILTVFARPALAGEFRSLAIDTGTTPNFTMVIPKGKAITVLNFQDAADQNTAFMLVQLNIPDAPPAATVLTAASANLNTGPAQKDLTICGPATVYISTVGQHFVYLCYKIFAN